jgi:hypothetical protein
MEPRQGPQKRRFQIETLEERIAPAHVHLPAAPSHEAGVSAAANQNPHFSGALRPLPVVIPVEFE